MHKEKITDAINRAMGLLDDSIRAMAKNNNNEKAAVDPLWLASSEIEYALFLFSLMHPDESEVFSWKHGSQQKQVVEARPTVVSAKELLTKAKNDIDNGTTERAYEEAWTARNLLLKVQEVFDKKRKSDKAQPTQTR